MRIRRVAFTGYSVHDAQILAVFARMLAAPVRRLEPNRHKASMVVRVRVAHFPCIHPAYASEC